MTLNVFRCLPWLGVIFFLNLICVRGEDIENCFLYPVNQDNTKHFEVPKDGDIHVMFNHIFADRYRGTEILDENGTCLVGLKHKNSVESSDCQINFNTDGEYTTLIFRRQQEDLYVDYMVENLLSYKISEFPSGKLTIKTDDAINVAFNCLDNCFKFRTALIHKKAWNRDNTTLNFYADIEDVNKANGTVVYGRRGYNWSYRYGLYLHTLNLFTVDIKQPLSFEFQATFTSNSSGSFIFVHLNMTTPQGESKDTQFDQPVKVPSKDVYLDFKDSSGILWSFCRSNQKEDGSNTEKPDHHREHGDSKKSFWEGKYKVHHIALVAVSALLTLLSVALCLVIVSSKKQHKPHDQTPKQVVTTDTTRAKKEAPPNENIYESLYETIDMAPVEAQHYHSRQNLHDHEILSKSRTSLNSIYGYGDDECNDATLRQEDVKGKIAGREPPNNEDAENVSINSVYGYVS